MSFHSQSVAAELAPTSEAAFSQSAFGSTSRNQYAEGSVHKSLSGFTGKVLGKPERDSGATVKRDNVVFLKGQARRVSAKEGADITGMSPKGFQKLQQGENTISFDKLIEWCRNDPRFAAAFAEHVGLIRPGHADFVGRMNQAIAASQRLHMGGDAE